MDTEELFIHQSLVLFQTIKETSKTVKSMEWEPINIKTVLKFTVNGQMEN